MARGVPLDKVVPAGTTFITEKREAFIANFVGTNATTDGTLFIDEKPVITLNSLVAPHRLRDSNLLGPLRLGDLYIVIPPETKYVWQGPSGSVLRLIGTKILLDPGEALGEPYISRYRDQFNSIIVYREGSYNHGVGNAWPAGDEREVLRIRPAVIEKYVFNNVLMASVENVSGGVADGDWGITIYIDGQPIDFINHAGEKKGIDVLSAPRPPTDSTEEVPFSLENYPIEVPGDHEISFRIVNNSGTSKTPTAGNAIIATVTVLAQYFRQPI
jgi:hypothetical protein